MISPSLADFDNGAFGTTGRIGNTIVMRSFLRAYYYLFYKLYKFSEAAPSKWLSDWKAGIIIIALELFLIASLFIYYKVFFNRYIHIGASNWNAIICVLFVMIPNYFAFIHTDVWKVYIQKFDLLSKEKNRKGSIIVFGVVFFIVANLIFSFYLMSQIDWSKYR